MNHERKRMERIRQWKQVAIWAPVLWFPLMLYCLLSDRVLVAIALGLAGSTFASVARAVVWLSRCPRCHAPYRQAEGGFRRIWNDAACAGCGLSLFALRRGESDDPDARKIRGESKTRSESRKR